MAACQETTMRIVGSGSILGGCCYDFLIAQGYVCRQDRQV